MSVTDAQSGLQIRVDHVAIRGVVSAVPQGICTNQDFADRFDTQVIDEITKMTGVERRHIAGPNQTTADLAEAAASRLLSQLAWSAESVDAIIFVSQTPDYRLPATACTLQHRLGLSKNCAALDVNLGCSGYVYGLWLASRLIDGLAVKRVLLLAGDTSSKLVNTEDRATALLFGDAGTATALEYNEQAQPAYYVIGTDGGGARHLMVPRSPVRVEQQEDARLSQLNPDYLYMDGAQVFNFTISSVPTLVKQLLSFSGQTLEGTEHFLFHQANAFMLRHIAKKLKIPADQFSLNLQRFGNTSSASIPLLLTDICRETPLRERVVMAGFGVGYSWAAVSCDLSLMQVTDLIEVES
ncbi:3-oxoacyl-ACP synthase III family protein [Undibacterium curvum]|uniref:Ketoacyl-ACP synthase III n=1 Tax=Undibacterium curvum TaxID=2762294 RepID=A0ABR7A2S5_9BURK|nr:ketoacyl-ACP synthase III [Undibacterium curvum]MBC3931220.1 ketoacyl-ACP synthase III [Undibacterium curvum]